MTRDSWLLADNDNPWKKQTAILEPEGDISQPGTPTWVQAPGQTTSPNGSMTRSTRILSWPRLVSPLWSVPGMMNSMRNAGPIQKRHMASVVLGSCSQPKQTRNDAWYQARCSGTENATEARSASTDIERSSGKAEDSGMRSACQHNEADQSWPRTENHRSTDHPAQRSSTLTV